jgi:hypothetical protein
MYAALYRDAHTRPWDRATTPVAQSHEYPARYQYRGEHHTTGVGIDPVMEESGSLPQTWIRALADFSAFAPVPRSSRMAPQMALPIGVVCRSDGESMKVSSQSNTKSTAGKIAHDVRDTGRAPTLLTIGSPSINQAMKVRASLHQKRTS